MEYCIEYEDHSSFKHFDDPAVTELNLLYDPRYEKLPSLLEKYSDKTIVLSLLQEIYFNSNEFKFLKALYNTYHNIKLKIPYQFFKNRPEEKEELKAAGIPYFFYDYVSDWDTLYGLLKENPTDVYIIRDLGFELDKVAGICHSQNTRIRVFPNYAQSSFEGTPALKKFFIRTEDVPYYEKFVDIFEFFYAKDRKNVFFEIYQKGEWFGKLNEYIMNFNDELDSRGIVPIFGRRRVTCNKRCLKVPNSCHLCEAIGQLSDTIIKKGAVLLNHEVKNKEDNADN